MLKRLFILLWSLCLFSVALAQTPRDREVRALWVVRTTLTSPEKIRRLVNSAADNGFNTLIVQVRGRGDAYYKSRVEPRAMELKDQPADFDPLALTIAEAHSRGLKVHAWLNTSLLANLDALPTDPTHVYNRRPEWLAVPKPVAAELYQMSPRDPLYRQKIVEWSRSNRAELEGIYTGPVNPAVKEHILKIWMDVLKHYRVDGMHFDYVRFASPDFDYSRRSLRQFYEWLKPQLSDSERRELKQQLKENPLAAAETFAPKFADFQRTQVTALVERIYRAVKKQRPDVIVRPRSSPTMRTPTHDVFRIGGVGCRWESSMSLVRWRTQRTRLCSRSRLRLLRVQHRQRIAGFGRALAPTESRLIQPWKRSTSRVR